VTENTKVMASKASANVAAGTSYMVNGTKQGVENINKKIDENSTLKDVKTKTGAAWGATTAAASNAKASIDTKIEANPRLSSAKANTDAAVK